MGRGLMFKQKEVINIRDGRRVGLVKDVEVDYMKGRIVSIVVHGTGKLFCFGSKNDVVIAWECIVQIGDDIVLVDIE